MLILLAMPLQRLSLPFYPSNFSLSIPLFVSVRVYTYNEIHK